MNSQVQLPRTIPYFWMLAFFTWLGFALVAVAGGIFRVVWLEPRMGENPANLLETLGLVVVLGSMVWIAVPWLCPRQEGSAIKTLGLFWAGLTIAFEFGFGHFVDGADWSALLANYDITAGRLWILVPLTMGVGPWLVRRMKLAPVAGTVG
jgi:hypothetical protein